MKEWNIYGEREGFEILTYQADYVTTTDEYRSSFSVVGWKKTKWWRRDRILWRVVNATLVASIEAEPLFVEGKKKRKEDDRRKT
jgi:hypothetical protein